MVGSGGLPRELAPGLHWIGNCIVYAVGGAPVHTYHSVYVIAGADRSLVVDTGYPKDWRVVDQQLDELCAAGLPPVAYIFPSHAEIPHAANTGRMLAKFPDAVVCGDIRDYHLMFPDYADRLLRADTGAQIELGGRTLTVLEAIFNDHSTTRWLLDEQTRTLFTGDGFAYSHFHAQDGCGRAAEELPDLAMPELVAVFSDAAFFWTRFVDLDPLIERLEAMLARYEIALIAPAHGCPILDPALTVPKAIAGLRLGQTIQRAELGERLVAHLEQHAAAGSPGADGA